MGSEMCIRDRADESGSLIFLECILLIKYDKSILRIRILSFIIDSKIFFHFDWTFLYDRFEASDFAFIDDQKF